MATGYVNSSKLTAIADSIRSKKGTSDLMSLDQMPTEIAGIGGGDNNAQVDWSKLDSTADVVRCLTKLDTTGIDTSNVTDMSNFFQYYSGSNLDVTGFDTSKVTNMSNLFYDCGLLKTIDLSGWDTSKVTSARQMFYACKSLEEIILPKNAFTNADSYKWSNSIFSGCKNLKKLNSADLCYQKFTTCDSMFANCNSIETLDLSNINVSNVTSFYDTFYYCSALKTIDLSSWDTSNATNMERMFYYCSSLEKMDLSHINVAKVNNVKEMFAYCNNLKELDLSNWSTSSITSFYWLFRECNALKTIDLSGWDTSKVTDMYGMFHGCTALETLDLSNFNTEKVTRMDYMFSNCPALKTLNISTWDTSSLTSTSAMFYSSGGMPVEISWPDNWGSNSSFRFFDISTLSFNSSKWKALAEKIATRTNSPVLYGNTYQSFTKAEIQLFTDKGWSVSSIVQPAHDDPSKCGVGETASINGIATKCIYVADTPQTWGTRIYISTGSLGSLGYIMSNGYKSIWGPSEKTGVTGTDIGLGLENTNKIMDLGYSNSENTIWNKLANFRSIYGDGWFIPTQQEARLYYNGNDMDYPIWTSTESPVSSLAIDYNFRSKTSSATDKSIARYARVCIYV